jgi:hypothetical protein
VKKSNGEEEKEGQQTRLAEADDGERLIDERGADVLVALPLAFLRRAG